MRQTFPPLVSHILSIHNNKQGVIAVSLFLCMNTPIITLIDSMIEREC